MKLETFFEKFELFADAPNGVERLRELVLQLAVSTAVMLVTLVAGLMLFTKVESTFMDTV